MDLFIDAWAAQLTKYGEELCGDNYALVRKPDAMMVVLSDGLGSGVKANILATLTIKILATMLENDCELDEVVETISQTLPICQVRKIAYSTFTIARINRDGDTYLAEFDNPQAFYLRQGKLTTLSRSTRAVGGKTVYEARFQLSMGDDLVLVTDGVIHAGVGGVLNLGWRWDHVAEYIERIIHQEGDAQAVAQWLLTATDQLYARRPGDDATVIALRARAPKTTTVLVGPPVDPADDDQVVRKLLAEAGQKVVCGGTTSNIVARLTGEPVTVNLDTLSRNMPPTGRIKGIDLVTEGIMTLAKALKIIQDHADEKSRDQGRDGATQLAKVLLQSDRISFLVGRAINPAHQNPNLPISLALKMNIVNELGSVLKAKGKDVKLSYY